MLYRSLFIYYHTRVLNHTADITVYTPVKHFVFYSPLINPIYGIPNFEATSVQYYCNTLSSSINTSYNCTRISGFLFPLSSRLPSPPFCQVWGSFGASAGVNLGTPAYYSRGVLRFHHPRTGKFLVNYRGSDVWSARLFHRCLRGHSLPQRPYWPERSPIPPGVFNFSHLIRNLN